MGPAGPCRPGRTGGPGRRQPDRPDRRAIPAAGIVSVASLDGTSCTTFDGKAGRIDVGSTATDLITLTCEAGATPPPSGSSRLVINEVDYDQVGADADGFVEIANTGTAAATLDGIALVLVNGGDGAEYARKTLTGSLAAGATFVIDVELQNGAPDGVALVDTGKDALLDALSYEGAITAATIGTKVFDLVEGTMLPVDVARLEHGRRVALADSRRHRHGQRGGGLVVHDDPDARGREREDAVRRGAGWGRRGMAPPPRPVR